VESVEGVPTSGSLHGHYGVSGIAAHPFGFAQGRLLQKTQGWGTRLRYGEEERRVEGWATRQFVPIS